MPSPDEQYENDQADKACRVQEEQQQQVIGGNDRGFTKRAR